MKIFAYLSAIALAAGEFQPIVINQYCDYYPGGCQSSLQCWGPLYDVEHSSLKFSLCVARSDCGKDSYVPTGDSAPAAIKGKTLMPDNGATCKDPEPMPGCIYNADCAGSTPDTCGFY